MPIIHKIGEDNPIQIRSNGTVAGTTVRVRGEDGEWRKLDAALTRVVIEAKNDLVLAHLTIINPEVTIETSAVAVNQPPAIVFRTEDGQTLTEEKMVDFLKGILGTAARGRPEPKPPVSPPPLEP